MKVVIDPIKLILFLALVIVINACNKKAETNYFRCNMNGQKWEAEHGKGLGDYPLTAKLYGDTLLHMNALNGNESITIIIKTFVRTGEYDLRECNYHSCCASYANNFSANDYLTDSIRTGYINVTALDKKNLLVEGDFSFNAICSDSIKTISITDGKFSIPLQKY